MTPFMWRSQLKARLEQKELLDLGFGTQQEVCQNLEEMDVLNQVTRGKAGLLSHLGPRLRSGPGPYRILDLGTGSGNFLAHLVSWTRAQSLNVDFIGVDWSLRNLDCEKQSVKDEAHIQLLGADAHCLPFACKSFDYAISSLFLHHFSPAELVSLFKSVSSVTRRGLIMTDLVRGWLPLLAFRLGQPVFARNYLTRQDGKLSIRRAYRPEELLRIAQQAGLVNAKVYPHFPWRMTLAVDL